MIQTVNLIKYISISVEKPLIMNVFYLNELSKKCQQQKYTNVWLKI